MGEGQGRGALAFVASGSDAQVQAEEVRTVTRARQARVWRLSRGLGWFSVGLGAWELLAPRQVARMLGAPAATRLIRLYGVRELKAGAGLLLGARKAPWLWARFAGDLVDLATLAAAVRRGADRRRVALAAGSVLGVTALDLYAGASASA